MESEPFSVMSETVSNTMKQTREAMEKYFNFIQKGMSGSLWAETDLTKKMKVMLSKISPLLLSLQRN